MPLSTKQRLHLRALAHHLNPTVQVGHNGVTDAVIAQVEGALVAHELIKVKLGSEAPESRDAAATALSAATSSEVAQIIGSVVVLYRRRPKKPKVDLPLRNGAPRKEKAKGSKGKKPRRKTGKSGKTRKPGQREPAAWGRTGRPRKTKRTSRN
jgi:RNA-binding protein